MRTYDTAVHHVSEAAHREPIAGFVTAHDQGSARPMLALLAKQERFLNAGKTLPITRPGENSFHACAVYDAEVRASFARSRVRKQMVGILRDKKKGARK